MAKHLEYPEGDFSVNAPGAIVITVTSSAGKRQYVDSPDFENWYYVKGYNNRLDNVWAQQDKGHGKVRVAYDMGWLDADGDINGF